MCGWGSDDDEDDDFYLIDPHGVNNSRSASSEGSRLRSAGERRPLQPRHDGGRRPPPPARSEMGDGYEARLVAGGQRKRKPRQEISACLKWFSFLINFCIFLVGLTVLSLGIYLNIKDPRGVTDWADVVLNPAIMLAILGFGVCVVAMIGVVGALRDNIQLLKTFSVFVFVSYIVLVSGAFSLFFLFYTEGPEGFSAHRVLNYALRRYDGNRNIADLVDYMQEQLGCCGVSSAAAGYRDWTMSSQFNCSDTNPYPERCGVPYSCCRRSVISEAQAGSANPLLPAIRSLQCWQNALKKRPQDVEADIHTRGCLTPLRNLFEQHALHIGMIVAVLIIPICLFVCLANVLARQIDTQRWLLQREARRHDRRRKRERERMRVEEGAAMSASAAAFRSMEAGTLPMPIAAAPPIEQPRKPSKAEGIPPRLPDTPPPDKPPAEYATNRKTSRMEKRGTRAASVSPTRKITPSGRPSAEPQHRKKESEHRQRSVPPKGAVLSPPSHPSQSRTRHWVLQQSDFVNPRPNP